MHFKGTFHSFITPECPKMPFGTPLNAPKCPKMPFGTPPNALKCRLGLLLLNYLLLFLYFLYFEYFYSNTFDLSGISDTLSTFIQILLTLQLFLAFGVLLPFLLFFWLEVSSFQRAHAVSTGTAFLVVDDIVFGVLNCTTSRGSGAACNSPHRRFLRHFRALWGLSGPQCLG